MKEYDFKGSWITNREFCELKPENVFHRQLEAFEPPCDGLRNRHILFRKCFELKDISSGARIYISADDYYKLYINGRLAAQGPAPSYSFRYNYNVIDVSRYLKKGRNVIAVHTLYQGLINRVWQSGDNRHGLILDLVAEDGVIISSDESFRVKAHSAYRETGTAGYLTQFLEEYDSRAPEVGFEKAGFNDESWENAEIRKYADYTLTEQKTDMLVYEKIYPVKTEAAGNKMLLDFGANYVGYLNAAALGKSGAVITVRCGQEMNDDGSVRYNLRANCTYEETWILAGGESRLEWFDYKSFRYAELLLPDGCVIKDVYVTARHYPFELKTALRKEFSDNEKLKSIWDLCIHTQKYGVQEVIHDCMEREKGFYVGDGCYTAAANMILTGDDKMVRKLIDDGFLTECITDSLVTCLDCSFMQEIAEFPLMLIYLVLWHYNFAGDKAYLEGNYEKAVKLLEVYRRNYEKDYLLCNLDKWCVVEWPKNFQHGYDVDIREGMICREPHISINAYYIEAIRTVNKMAEILGMGGYRDLEPVTDAFEKAFYDRDKQLFRDGMNTDHISLVGNIFPFAFELCPGEECRENIINMISEYKISSLSLFCTFLAMEGMVRYGRYDMIKEALLDEGAWLRMINEGATTTFEGWGKDTKWNTSLFHLTMSYAVLFMADIDIKKILG
ncbi:MAG: family 78 glycoside hydrolase catalytic domain [Clostridia bacterium]|nr:family 78 glycoside hydrolase catalytic domain [Clostridia bacterium]